MIFVIMILGVMCGNYITSFYYRISNNMTVNGSRKFSGEPPHCSTCKHPLRFYEFLPILSMISTKFSMKCNYCKAPISKIYTILECAIAAVFIANYLVLGVDQKFILISAYAATMILFMALLHKGESVPLYITLFICFLGVIYRTIDDATFYQWLMQLLLYAILIMSRRSNQEKLDFFQYQYIPVMWASCWLAPYELMLFMSVYLVANLFKMPKIGVFYLNFIFIYGAVLSAGAG